MHHDGLWSGTFWQSCSALLSFSGCQKTSWDVFVLRCEFISSTHSPKWKASHWLIGFSCCFLIGCFFHHQRADRFYFEMACNYIEQDQYMLGKTRQPIFASNRQSALFVRTDIFLCRQTSMENKDQRWNEI